MTNDNGIFIQNVYYMLAYAFEALQQASFEHIAQEPFAHVHDLLGAILAKGMALQIKQGMYKQYVPAKADLPVLRGRVDVQQTFANQARRQKKLACLYEELSADNLPNQVLKSTAWLLLCLAPLKEQTQASLKRALLYYEPVSLVEPAAIAWKSLRLERKNQSMQMLLNICYFVLNHLLLTTESGRYQMAAFLDEHGMARLFEKFVLEYLKKHYPQFHASSPQVAWNEDSGQKEFLPVMQPDITLRCGKKICIIDTKYYSQPMQQHFQTRTWRSSHLYQIYTYVKNADTKASGDVMGLLLYAKAAGEAVPDKQYRMQGNPILVRTLDLQAPFCKMEQQLGEIARLFEDSSCLRATQANKTVV